MLQVRGITLTRETLAKMIDFSILHPYTQEKDILQGLEYCRKYKFNSFCVNPNFLSMIVDGLKGTDVEPSVVLDFPFGAGTRQMKLAAAEDAVKRGAKALDMVIDIGALKDKNYKLVIEEIRDLVKAAEGAKTKIIIEVAYLTKEEIVAACKCVEEGGGHYVKSSTGRADRGPTMEEVKLMRESVSENVGVKVAGTGRFWTSQIAFGCLLAGADLIGTRSGPQIVEDLPLLEEMYGNRLKVV
ncbi:MAG: deoxyribose-phosphate aldolase [Firmicutes bacterium]|nr:deoxyribose-phosphate aldolase [Bacillota bacterium]